MRVVPGWEDAAKRINFTAALDSPVDLTEDQYLALHDGRTAGFPASPVHDEFVVDRVGTSNGPEFYDRGIEYYRFVESEQA
jgi:hydroxymethylglutaryl-CoA synthase